MSEVVLRRFCDHCQLYREPHEIRMAGPAHAAVAVCVACGGALRKEAQRVTTSLSTALARAYAYPFMLAIGLSTVGCALVSAFVSFVPLVGGMLSATIVVAFVFLVLRSSAEGRDDLASDEEVAGRLVLWLEPLFRYLLTWLVVGPLNPVPALRIIARIPGPYFLTLAFLLATLLLGAGAYYVARLAVGGIPLLGPLVVRVIGLYAPVVMARQLGVLVHEHREEL